MAKRIEFFVGDSLDVYENIAFEYGLLKSCPDDALRIFLWSNDRTVVIGKNQNAFSEVNLDALKSIDGRLPGAARFITTGTISILLLWQKRAFTT